MLHRFETGANRYQSLWRITPSARPASACTGGWPRPRVSGLRACAGAGSWLVVFGISLVIWTRKSPDRSSRETRFPPPAQALPPRPSIELLGPWVDALLRLSRCLGRRSGNVTSHQLWIAARRAACGSLPLTFVTAPILEPAELSPSHLKVKQKFHPQSRRRRWRLTLGCKTDSCPSSSGTSIGNESCYSCRRPRNKNIGRNTD
jgi:hypothetical protein